MKRRSIYFNVSISLALTLGSGQTFASAFGSDDRISDESSISASSLFPSGSVTKAFTATAAMTLVEAGLLDLDEPVYKLVDPWLKAQGLPSMLQLWDGEPHIQLVTTRQLLQMRSGIPDYDDELIREFALEHPDEDFVPLGFISGVDKHFLFPPGSGGSYSSVGFVLIGWILAAASAAPRWEALDQRGLVEANSTFALEYSTFAGRGACSQYERVVHQYMYRPGGRNLAAGRQQDDSHCTRHDQHSWFDNSHLQATPIGEQPIALGSAEACCAQADRFQGATYWEFQRGSAGGGVCTFYKGAAQLAAHWPNATAGMVDVSVSESDFIDLIDGSCLNGWTMGNLAAAPSDLTRCWLLLASGNLVPTHHLLGEASSPHDLASSPFIRFYHALLDEQSILSAASLQQMMAWKPLSKGFSTGTPYGLGLMRQTMQIGVQVQPHPIAQSRASGAA